MAIFRRPVCHRPAMDIQQKCQVLNRLPLQECAAGNVVGAVFAAVREGVVGIAAGPVLDESEAPAQAIGNRAADATFDLVGVERAVFDMKIAGVIIRRLDRDEIDRATAGVAAVQRSLRALQNLDTFQIEGLECLRGWRAEIHFIEIDTVGAGIVGIVIVETDTADRNDRLIAGTCGQRNADIRCELAEVGGGFDAKVLNSLGIEGLNRQRHGLNIFRPLLRCDHNGFDSALRSGVLGGGTRPPT